MTDTEAGISGRPATRKSVFLILITALAILFGIVALALAAYGWTFEPEVTQDPLYMRITDITPVSQVITPDGQTAWVGLGKANHVAEVDVASRKVRRTVLAGKRAWGLALSADASRLYVANGLSDDMTTIDTASGKALKTVPAGRVPHSVLVLK